jgi:hypothetical protein
VWVSLSSNRFRASHCSNQNQLSSFEKRLWLQFSRRILHNFGAAQIPLQSTLAKVYQNKQLHLPLESTLVKNRGEEVVSKRKVPPLSKHPRLAIAIGRFKERRQGVGGGVRGMPHIGEAKGGFNGLQQ